MNLAEETEIYFCSSVEKHWVSSIMRNIYHGTCQLDLLLKPRSSC